MKFRQMLKKKKSAEKAKNKQKQILLLGDALKKLLELKIAVLVDSKLRYSKDFEDTALALKDAPPNRLTQAKLAGEVGRKLIPQLLAMAVSKPSRRDVENMIVSYVVLKRHIEAAGLTVDKAILADLAYAVWYLNDNEPSLEEINEWTLQV